MDTIDAVLPLTLSDYERSLVLRRSLARFARGLGTLYMVVPQGQFQEFRSLLQQASDDGIDVALLSEAELVPEMAAFHTLKGWYKQQLAKLAIAERVNGAFYLTLDADVVATRPLTPEALVPGGKADCSLIEEPAHADWYQHSGEVLGYSVLHPGFMHSVTPAVLARQGCKELFDHLNQRWEQRRFRPHLRGLGQRWAALRFGRRHEWAGWRLYLASGAPWTEYALYYGQLEHSGRFDEYHRLTEHCIYDVKGSVWRKDAERFDDWDPAPFFRGQGPPYFVVIQSKARINPARVRAKLAPHLEA